MSINTMKLALEALENASPAAWASRVDSDTMKSIWRKHAEALAGLQALLTELDNTACKSVQKRLEAQQPASKEHLFELWWEAHMPNATQEQAWTAFTAAVASNGVGIAAQQPATPEPVYWEWRHQGSHPDAVDFGQWSEWKRVEPRSAIHTVEDALNEFRGYIARGHKYELRAIYTHPAPSAAVTPEPVVSRNPFASRCYTMSESHLSGHRLIVGFEKLGDAQDAHEWVARQARGDFTHPSPSVPDDVVRDAISTVREHYRGTDWGKAAESICDAIEAAMLAAKDASA